MFESDIIAIDTPREDIYLDRVGSARYPFDVLATDTIAAYFRLDEEDPTAFDAESLYTQEGAMSGSALSAVYYGTSGTDATSNPGRIMGAIEGPHAAGGDYHRHPWIDARQNGGVVIANGATRYNMALGVWVKPDDLGESNRRRVIGASWTYGLNTAGSKAGWWVELDASDHWNMYYALTGDTSYRSFAGPAASGDWQFIVVRWKGTDISAELEIDGTIIDTEPQSTGNAQSAGGNIGLGITWTSDDSDFPPGDKFRGYFGECEIHDTGLSIPTIAVDGTIDTADRLARSRGTVAQTIRAYNVEANDDLTATRDNDEEPGREGTRIGDQYGRARILTYTGSLDADDFPTKNVERQRIRGAANALMRDDGRVRWKPAGFDVCQMRVRRHEAPRIAAAPSATGMVLSFIAGDPRVYSAALNVLNENGTGAVGTPFDVENLGDWQTPPRFVVWGPITGPSLTNHATGEVIEFPSLVVASGDYLEIDCDPDVLSAIVVDDPSGTPVVTDVYDEIDDSTSEFFELQPGVNEIELGGTGAGVATRLFVIWRHAWMP